MSSIIWYRFSGCCDGSIFQVQVNTPPILFEINNFYYLITDVYIGCTNLLSTGFTSGVDIYNLSSYDSITFIDCPDCVNYHPCQSLPTPSPTSSPPPTPSITRTVTPSKSLGITPAPTNSNTRTPSVGFLTTPTVTQTSLCPIYIVDMEFVSGGTHVQITNNLDFSLFVSIKFL